MKDWLSQDQIKNRQLNVALLTQAGDFVEKIGNGKNTAYGDSVLQHGLAMADELLKLNCDSETLAASIAYGTIFYLHPPVDTIKKYLPVEIHQLITGVSKMDALQQTLEQKEKSNLTKQADNLRKMCLAMVGDVRIVLIKLVEQLVILKHLRRTSSNNKQKIAQQVSTIYAPLANRLGLGHIKWEMEDLSFRYLHPEEYKKISQALNMKRQDREKFIDQMIDQLDKLLKNADVQNAQVTGRAKHIYSIHRKIQRKRVEFSEIYDTSAVRILVQTIEDCYKTLSAVHTQWSHINREFDDYVAKPKGNGYQSIHTVIVTPENINVEIQIRTYQMHEESELGIAAHWQYKEGGGKASSYAEKINWLRNIMDWQKEVSQSETQDLYQKTFEDRVYVFTPNGDVFDLEAGATPLDFAYHVHTDVGHHCRGAKVNDHMVPLTYPLRTGDQVSILTNQSGTPSRDWLNPTANYLKTTTAKQKVRNWFHKEEQENYLTTGQALWEKNCRREGISKQEIKKAAEIFKFKTTQELLIAMGSGELGILSVINRIKHPEGEAPKKTLETAEDFAKKITTVKDKGLRIEGVGNLLTKLALCCRAIPGDEIIGYITQGQGITIHQKNCRNAQFALKNHPERLLNVEWGTQTKQAYPVVLHIEADDRPGLIHDITEVINSAKVHLLGLNSRVDTLKDRAYVSLTIELQSLEPLRKILLHLQQVPSITQVKRK